MDGLRRMIQLVLDPKSTRDLETEAKEALDKGTDPRTPTKNLSAVESVMDRVKRAAVALGSAILAAFSFRAISNFVQSSINASIELESSRIRVAQALRNEGIELNSVNRELQAFTRSLWETHRLTEGEINPVLQQLITITGDYDLSLRGVGLAADLAAAANMDVNSAARLLGRVLRGETTALTRYGIVIEEGADAAEVLEEKLRGMALAATPATTTLAKAFGDLKEEIGFALREATDFDAKVVSLSEFTVRLKDNTDLLRNSARELVRALRDLVTVVGVLIGVRGLMALRTAFTTAGGSVNFLIARLRALHAAMGPAGWITLAISGVIILLNRMKDAAEDAARAAEEAAQVRRDLLAAGDIQAIEAELQRVQDLMAAEQQRMAQLRRQTVVDGVAMAETQLRILELSKEEREIQERLTELRAQQAVDAVRIADATAEAATPRRIGGVQIGGLLGLERQQLQAEQHAAFIQTLTQISTEGANAQAAAAVEAARMAQEALVSSAQSTAESMTNAFAAFFQGMAQGFLGITTFGEALKQSVTGLGAAIIEELTKGKAEYHMAEGVGKLATGTWPPNALAIKAASQHFIAAGMFRALPGIVRSMGRPSMRAGGTSIPSAMAATRPTATPERQQAEINIYIDPLNPSNPAWQSTLAQTLRGVRQRYGNATVNVRPRTA